jgi:hypothetical protein
MKREEKTDLPQYFFTKGGGGMVLDYGSHPPLKGGRILYK